MEALNTHERPERQIEGLRAPISRLSAANLRIRESPDLETLPHEALEGNGIYERFIRTLKEQLLWVRHFQSNAELVQAPEKFRAIHNYHHLIERLGFEPQVQPRRCLAPKPQATKSWPDCRMVCGRRGEVK